MFQDGLNSLSHVMLGAAGRAVSIWILFISILYQILQGKTNTWGDIAENLVGYIAADLLIKGFA